MRKNKAGRPARIKDVEKKIKSLRKGNFSFTEIGVMLGGMSKQLVRYHFTKDLTKNRKGI